MLHILVLSLKQIARKRSKKSPRKKRSRKSRTRYETRTETKYVYVPRVEYKYVPYYKYRDPQIVERHHYHQTAAQPEKTDDIAEIKKRYHNLTGLHLTDAEAREQIRGGMLARLRAMR